jgi:hypothetical protein
VAVGIADPETRAVIERVKIVAPEAVREAERWQDRAAWDAGELTLIIASRSRSVAHRSCEHLA